MMMKHMLSSKADIAGLLTALALGYIVCYLAKREEKNFKTLGYVIGTVIMILATVALVSKMAWRLGVCSKGGYMGSGLDRCPKVMMHKGQMMQPPAQPQPPNPQN